MLKKFFSDPLALFLMFGVVIYAAQGMISTEVDVFNIKVRDTDISRLRDQWSMQMRRPPSDQELDGLVKQFIKEEIYYREGRRLGLDENDTIVRRRLVQKLTFLTEDIASAVAPTPQEIAAYYQSNKENYELPVRYSFKHRYFSSDRRDDAQSDAQAAVADSSVAGDPFMLQRAYASRSEREIGDLFGREFATDLSTLHPNQNWQGPIKSAYGWHAIFVTSRAQSRLPELNEIYDRVLVDAKQAQRQTANRQYYESLSAQYKVSYPAGFAVPVTNPLTSP